MAGAGLDVMEQEPTLPDNPLHTMENVVLTPHTASVSDIGNVRRRQRVGHEIAAVLQGKMPFSVVNREVLNVVDAEGEQPADLAAAQRLIRVRLSGLLTPDALPLGALGLRRSEAWPRDGQSEQEAGNGASAAARGDDLGWRDRAHTLIGGSGPPLLVLHGAGGPNGWRRWHAALAEQFTLYVPSHPGYGLSDSADWMESPRDLARYYLWYLDTLGLERARIRRALAGRLHRGRAGRDEPAGRRSAGAGRRGRPQARAGRDPGHLLLPGRAASEHGLPRSGAGARVGRAVRRSRRPPSSRTWRCAPARRRRG